MNNHYEVLGVNTSATTGEIRRAYRILARRYHPDVNPGAPPERFAAIAEAYEVLSNNEAREKFDLNLDTLLREQAHDRLRQSNRKGAGEKPSSGFAKFGSLEAEDSPLNQSGEEDPLTRASNKIAESISNMSEQVTPKTKSLLSSSKESLSKLLTPILGAARNVTSTKSEEAPGLHRISIIEVSVDVLDAIRGIKKTVEIEDSNGIRKISVRIPPAVHTGSVVRLRSTKDGGEELVIIVRLAKHPFLSIEQKGLIVDLPVTVNEAISGARITVPTLEEPAVVKVPEGIRNGHEIRIRGKGVPDSEGERGDIFARLHVAIPTCTTAVGLSDQAANIDLYYEAPVREHIPTTLTGEE